jgi:formate dehydrogenase major subunit
VASLAARFGRGAMTNSWEDIKNADVVLVMGGNPAENHPCGFYWALRARRDRGAKIICVDVRYTRTAAVSDIFVQIRPGTDLAFVGGLINYVIQNKKYNVEYVRNFTNATYIVKDTYSFDPETGLFSGYDANSRKYDTNSWDYEKDSNGKVKKDMEMEHPRCVFQLFKQFYSRYTPEVVEKITGVPKEKFLEIAKIVAETGIPDKSMTHLYALGWTHHSFGTQLIGSMAILQLLLGNIGVPGGQIGALRGHSNVQGATDLAATWSNLPGYLKQPKADDETLQKYIENNTPKPLDDGAMNFWSNTSKFIVSLLKAFYGDNATKENDFHYDYLPKIDKAPSWDTVIDYMYKGKIEGLVVLGANLLCNSPNAKKTLKALSNLKWLVVIDPFETETASFWEKLDKPLENQTEVLILPSSVMGEKEGSKTSSSRRITWSYKAVDPPGEVKNENWILGKLFLKLRELYQKEGGKFPDPILKANWPYKNPYEPHPEELLAEINGIALEDITDDKGNLVAKKGERLPSFIHLKDDGSTLCGCWIYSGVFPQSGNRAKSVDLSDPSGLGIYPNFAFTWPANRRILYNRASANPEGKPWSPQKKLIWWNEKENKWVGHDVPDIKPDLPPSYAPFIMLPEGRGRLFSCKYLVDGPFPEFYEPVESPVPNLLHPKTQYNPVVKIYKSEDDVLGSPDKFPYVATTYRITEHYHFFTKFLVGPSILAPKMFIELPEELAKEKGIQKGEKIRVVSARGVVEGYAMPTRRIKPLNINGKKVYVVGIPIHWGFKGIAKGSLANLITPFIFDPNSFTPEYKGFLCNVEKIK